MKIALIGLFGNDPVVRQYEPSMDDDDDWLIASEVVNVEFVMLPARATADKRLALIDLKIEKARKDYAEQITSVLKLEEEKQAILKENAL